MESSSVGRLIGTRSLTKDLLFFLTFIFQVVVLFVFFWQKRQNVRRFFLGEHSSEEDEEHQDESASETATTDSHSPSGALAIDVESKTQLPVQLDASFKVGKEKEKSPEEQELDAEFQPIASTILELKRKIKGLEGTLHRRQGHYASDSLKIRLQDCIQEITSTLSEIGSIHREAGSDTAVIAAATNVSPNTSKIDILSWSQPDVQQSLSWIAEKRHELEAAAQLAAQQALAQANRVASTAAPVGHVSPRQDFEEAPQRADDSSRVTQAVAFSNATNEASDSESEDDTADAKSEKSDAESEDPDSDKSASDDASTSEKPAQDDDFDAAALQEQLMGMMNKKGGKARVKGVAGMNLADLEFAPEPAPVSPQPAASGKADLFSLWAAPSETKQDATDDDEDDLAAALAKKLGSFDEPKQSDSDEEDSKSESQNDEEASDADEKDDLLASLNALAGPKESSDDEANASSDDEDNTEDDGKNDLLASLNALAGGAEDDEEDSGKNDLLASLNALGGLGSEPQSDDDDNESDSESAASSEKGSDTENQESSDVPLLQQFGSAGDINTSGLKRAKKTVQMKGLSAGGPKYQMEDDWICIHPFEGSHDRALFCVFDGHAGKDAAAAAKEKLPGIFACIVDDAITDDENPDLSAEFKKAFVETDEEMKDYEYEGTTATAVYIWRQGGSRFLQSGNVGDSSAVVVCDGVAKMISFDHRPTNPDEVARIRSMGITMNPGQTRLNGLAISRALGDHFPKSVDSGIIPDPFVSELIKLNSGHSHLIVASDGVWDVLTPQRAYDLIKDEDDAEKAAQTLIKTVTKSAKCTDNVSCIVVRL